MADWPILSIMIFLPLVGVAFIIVVRGTDPASVENIRRVALITTTFNFAASLALWAAFEPAEPDFQFVEKSNLIDGLVGYHFGVDGISMPFLVLIAFLMPLCVLHSWSSVGQRVRQYMVALLIFETLLIGAFSALDLVLFYMFFAGSALPLLVLIGGWGGAGKIDAAFKYFVFALAGSALLLICVLVIFWAAGTTDIAILREAEFSPELASVLWLALFVTFALTMALWPLHTWLVDTATEAPPAAAALTCAVVMKLGFYGFARLSIPLFPEASVNLSWVANVLAALTVVGGAVLALAQRDVRRMLAYAALVPMGIALFALFGATQQSLQGALVLALGHGLAFAALFLGVAMVTSRANTSDLSAFGGMVGRMPWFAGLTLVAILASVGVPGTAPFVGIFLAFVGLLEVSAVLALVAGVGIVIAAAVGFWFYSQLVLGPLEKESVRRMADLSVRETFVIAPLVLAVVGFGVFPQPLLTVSEASVNSVSVRMEAAGRVTPPPVVDSAGFGDEGSAADAVRRGLSNAQGVAGEGSAAPQ